MITAKEARRIAVTSGVNVAKEVNKIEPAIRAAAEDGKTCVIHFIDAIRVHNDVIPTALQNRVMAHLSELGYNVIISTYGDKYVPKGLSDDNGDGPLYINYGYVMSW